MVCSKESGIRGNASRARTMVLLKEVQATLIALENQIDSKAFDFGVLAIERTELRKELRDEKVKEFQPFQAIDFRSTDVRELPHKLRTLFEDNQVLRDQVKVMQYQVGSLQGKLKASEARVASLEVENARLGVALRDAGQAPDQLEAIRQLQEQVQSRDASCTQLQGRLLELMGQAEQDRALASQQARAAAARMAALEAKLAAALGVGAGGRVAGSSHRGGVKPPSRGPGGSARQQGLDDDDGAHCEAGVGRMPQPAGPSYGNMMLQPGGEPAPLPPSGDLPALLRLRAYGAAAASAGAAGSGALSVSTSRSNLHVGSSGSGSARKRSPSPPKLPSSARPSATLSHSPGTSIPPTYPSHHPRPGHVHAFSADAPSWHATSPHSPGGAAAAGTGPFTSGSPKSGSGMEMLQAGRASATSKASAGPAGTVRAINSSAVVVSRTLLPNVSISSRGSGGARDGGGGGVMLALGSDDPHAGGDGGGPGSSSSRDRPPSAAIGGNLPPLAASGSSSTRPGSAAPPAAASAGSMTALGVAPPATMARTLSEGDEAAADAPAREVSEAPGFGDEQ